MTAVSFLPGVFCKYNPVEGKQPRRFLVGTQGRCPAGPLISEQRRTGERCDDWRLSWAQQSQNYTVFDSWRSKELGQQKLQAWTSGGQTLDVAPKDMV